MSEQQPQQAWTQPPWDPNARAAASGAQSDGPAAPFSGPASQAQAPQQPYAAMAYYHMPSQPAPGVARRHVRRIAIGAGAAAALAAALAVAVAINLGPTTETSAINGSSASSSSTTPGGSSSLPFSGGTQVPGLGSDHDGDGSEGGALPGFGSGNGTGSSASGAGAATTAQEKGVVTIDSVLQYQQAGSAGTGMILSSDGLVLTNNHVIDGATAIQVTDESTGKQYTATVVGTDPSADVALLQLKGASGLTPITLDKDGGITSGTGITAIGNAEGTGNLVAAAGSVTGTGQTMTAQTETGAPSETLSGLIQFQAQVVSGDSGGPVLDSQGEVIGMTTAASSGYGSIVAYAITIDNALAVVHQIESGDTSGGITLGYPAFLGVALAAPQSYPGFGANGSSGSATNGATISGVIARTPAASAGLVAGDTITAVNGTPVASSDALSVALSTHKAGDRVSITWTSGTTGTPHTATVTLIAGPAN